jgi:hypothetical protein
VQSHGRLDSQDNIAAPFQMTYQVVHQVCATCADSCVLKAMVVDGFDVLNGWTVMPKWGQVHIIDNP